jgi:hypothetical protein
VWPGYQARRTNIQAAEAWAAKPHARLGRMQPKMLLTIHCVRALPQTLAAFSFHSPPLPRSREREREREREAASGPKGRRCSRACSSTGDVHPRVSAPPSSGSAAVPLAGALSWRAEELEVPIPDSDDIGSGERRAQGETFGCHVA